MMGQSDTQTRTEESWVRQELSQMQMLSGYLMFLKNITMNYKIVGEV